MQEEMLKRAAPEYAARYAAESPAVYNAYNKTVGDFAGIYGAEEFATTFNKDFKNVNAQQIANLKTLSTDLDKQQKYLSSAIDSGIYGENTEQARTELAQIEQMKKNVDGAIKFVENDTSVKEYYYNSKYKQLENSSPEIKAKYGDRGWDQMSEEQREDLIATMYRGDYASANASTYYKGAFSKIDTSTLDTSNGMNAMEAVNYNNAVDNIYGFYAEGGTHEQFNTLIGSITEGDTSFDYSAFYALQNDTDNTLGQMEANRDQLGTSDKYLDAYGNIKKVKDGIPLALETKLYYDVQAEMDILETMTGDELLDELVRLQGIRDNSTNDTVNEALDGLIRHAQLQMVGKTDTERAKVYQTMTDEYKNLDEYLAYEKQEIASLSERRDALKKELAKYAPGSTVYSYEKAKREYDMVCAELDKHISLYKDLQARGKDIESNRATYEALEKLDSEWKEKTASWGERIAYTLKDILDAFGGGALSVMSTTADVLGKILTPTQYKNAVLTWDFVGNTLLDEEGNVDVDFKRGWDSVSEDVYDTVNGTLSQGALKGADYVKDVLFDENGKLNISFKRVWDATMNDVHVHITEGGIRNSLLIRKLLDKPEEDPLTTYDPSYNNDFTNFVEDVASGIGAFVPGVVLAAVTGGGSLLIQGVIFGASTYHSSYNEAINNGATMGEAHAYAFLTGSVAAASEAIIGTPLEKGAGIVGKIIGDSKIVNPTLRSVYSWAASALGEGAEEMIESLVGTVAKVWTYDNDARVDVSELLYEGLVGATVGGLISSTRISGEYKAYKQDADHIQELIAQAEKISSPAEAQHFINELIATSTLIDSELKKGKIKYKENAEWLMYHYNAIAEAVTQKLPELLAQNGDVKAMRNNIDSIVLKGEGKSGSAYDSYGVEIASVLAGTDIQLYEAMLQRTDLDPEVRAELETQLDDLKAIVKRYSLVDYSKTRITNSDSKHQNRAAVKKTVTKQKAEVDLESVIRGAYDKVSSSPEALDKVIAEMRADGINIETLVATERERILGSLSRAYSESKYSGVQGDNRGIISYLEAVETAAKDQNYIKRLIVAEYLAKKMQGSIDIDEMMKGYLLDTKNQNNYNVNKYGGIEYGSQYTERVAGGRVSASDGSNNVLRKQGDDSREMSVRLGDGGKGSEFLDFQRQGSSGWLGGVQRFTARSLRGLFGSLRKIKLASIDSLSRTIPNEVYERFENTVLKNHDGTILSLYHFTDVVFSDFSIGDIGFHFGTINAAKKRKDDPRRRRRGEASIYKEVYLNIKQPAITTRDPGKWNVFSASHVLYQEGYLTSNEIESLKTYDGYAPVTSYDSEAAVKFRELLASKGIDGIIYDNGHEGELSVLALYPEQIYTVAENGVDLNNYSDIKFDVESFGNATVRGAYDKVSSSPEALDKVIAEMRADGINIETLVATERERLLGSLSRAYSESKYSGVQGDNRGIISYLEAVETAAKDQNYIKRLIVAEYLAKKQLASSDHSASTAIESRSADVSAAPKQKRHSEVDAS